MKLTCEQFASVVSADANIAKEIVYAVLSAAARVAVDQIQRGNGVYWRGLGTLEPVIRASRNLRVPATGEHMRLPARSGVRFRPGEKIRFKMDKPSDE